MILQILRMHPQARSDVNISNMKDRRNVTCGMCGRVERRDLSRGFCPVTARNISPNKVADRCQLYIPKASKEN